jgi:hypothetical protein
VDQAAVQHYNTAGIDEHNVCAHSFPQFLGNNRFGQAMNLQGSAFSTMKSLGCNDSGQIKCKMCEQSIDQAVATLNTQVTIIFRDIFWR